MKVRVEEVLYFCAACRRRAHATKEEVGVEDDGPLPQGSILLQRRCHFAGGCAVVQLLRDRECPPPSC